MSTIKTAAAVDPDRPSTAALIAGWVFTILPGLGLVFSSVMKFIQPAPPEEMAKYLAPLGLKVDQLVGLGILESTCVILYLIPQTSVLGAILVTGYLGGVIATHVRVGDYAIIPIVVMGVFVWLGLYLRNPKLRRMLPLNF